MKSTIAKSFGLLGLAALPAIQAANPVITHRQLADPNAFIFNDRIYAMCSNDDDNVNGYDMKSAVVISTKDLVNWTDHGDVFRTTRDAKWAAGSYAPTAVAAKGKVYMYFPNIASGVGVLIADKPEGPYKDPLGKALVSGSTYCPMAWCFDPAIFVDDDAAKSAYLVWGGGTPYGTNFRGIALNADMISVKGSTTTPNTPNSFEGPFIHKYKGNYYIHYPVNPSSNIEYGMSSTSPISGYTRKGVLLPNPTLNGQNINGNNNSHESVFEYKGNWYMMYHDRRLSTSSTYKRDVSIDKVEYNTDGTMKQVVVTAGMAQLGSFNPYDSIPAATMSAQSNIKASFNANTWINYLVPQKSGAWTKLTGVDFAGGALNFQVAAGTTSSGVSVEVRTGSATGTVAGTCKLSPTSSTTTLATTQCPVTGLTGVKDVYLTFVGTTANANFAWFRFQGSSAVRPVEAKPAVSRSVDYTVYDLRGNLVQRFTTSTSMNTANAWNEHSRSLAVGTYVVRIQWPYELETKKFVRAAD
ncbi:MAG: family 43 glycosylhydrolase [Fibrobacterota bacterium]|nr:family 43 glycosylhydrolase [Fibrobacterota bacterium]QQS05681.1 MAG: family 43 glycosylhydrolase [Fibrobacterota bacterium]